MKLLILSNCNNSNPRKLEDCMTKTELIIFLMKQYFGDIENVEILIEKCYPHLLTNASNVRMHSYPLVDHLIFVNSKGFYDMNMSFYKQLKKNTKYSVSTFCDNIKFSTCEDIIFTIDKCVYNKKLFRISPPLDSLIYSPRKPDNAMYILLSRPPIMINLYNTAIPNILTQISTLIKTHSLFTQENVELKIGLIDQKSVDWIDLDGIINETNNFDLYVDFIQEISKANLFFMTYKSLDKYLLYELAMCNTLIVSKNMYIDKHLHDELSIHIYNKNLEWNEIIDKIILYNARASLIYETSWINVLTSIVNKLQETEIQMSYQELSQSNTFTETKDTWSINTNNKHLNIHNKQKPHITKIETNVPLPITINLPQAIAKKPKKPLIFLQSQVIK